LQPSLCLSYLLLERLHYRKFQLRQIYFWRRRINKESNISKYQAPIHAKERLLLIFNLPKLRGISWIWCAFNNCVVWQVTTTFKLENSGVLKRLYLMYPIVCLSTSMIMMSSFDWGLSSTFPWKVWELKMLDVSIQKIEVLKSSITDFPSKWLTWNLIHAIWGTQNLY